MSTILIVDDYEVNQQLLVHILRRNHYHLHVASNGYEALDVLSTEPIDLVILDIDMPDMDGLSLLQKLRADSRWSQLPVIMLTASGDLEHRYTAKALGANQLLYKPVSSFELLDAVRAIIG